MHFSTKRQRFLVNQGYSFKVNHTSVCIHKIVEFVFVLEVHVHIPREFMDDVGSVHMYCGVYMCLEMYSPHFCLFVGCDKDCWNGRCEIIMQSVLK